MSKYSRIRRANTTRLPNTIVFSDHSVTFQKLNVITKPKPNDAATGVPSSNVPAQGDECGVTDDAGEVFGVILGRKIPISCPDSSCKSISEKEDAKLQRSVKKPFSIKRSISLSEGYSRIHDQYGPSVKDENGDIDTLPARPSKKKAQIFNTLKRFFRF